MSANDSIKKIKAAEDEAAAIRENAVNEAHKAVADAAAAAAERVNAAEITAAEEKKRTLAAVAEKAGAVANEERKDAVFEAERLYNRAARHRDAAIRYICLEIQNKCQS